tara:strand:+ start:303 stop:605 length:303 start_codon:yes stop_codon:yes gene_type:complete
VVVEAVTTAHRPTQILVDLAVEQTMVAIQELRPKDPRTHHIVEQLDLISMEMLVVMDQVVQSIIMAAVVVPVVSVAMAVNLLLDQVLEEMGNHSLDLLDL